MENMCHSFIEKTTTLVERETTTLVGRLTTKMGSKDVGDEVAVEVPTKALGLDKLKEKLKLAREGSSGEIGWIKSGEVVDPVQDETDLFYSIFEQLQKEDALGSSSEQLMAHSYLLVPGLFCNSYPTYFREILAYFKGPLNLDCEFAHINTEGAVKGNAATLRDIIVAQYEQYGKTVVLLGHSKGGTDAAAACAMYWTELCDKVRGVILLQSPYGGTPLAADLLSGGEFGALNSVFLGKLASFANPDGTVEAVKDLTYKSRHEFLQEYPMPSEVPTLCFHSNFPPDSKARFIKYVLKENLLKGSVVVPLHMQLGKQLALMAHYILSRYPGVESDGLVARNDAEVPGSVVVKFREDLSHALVIPELFPPEKNHEDEIAPSSLNASLVCQACVMLLLTTR